jgi:uncharacterized membrane protein
MNTVIFVSFDTEQKAYQGERALREMHRDGSITLYDATVVVKQPGGQLIVREEPDGGPLGTFGGMVTGGLIGLLGGPIGAAVGMGTGTLIGAAFDVNRAGIASDFVDAMGAGLPPGYAAVIAEIDEDWQVPLDTRMEGLGGKLLRQTPAQVEDAYYERELAAQQKELASLEAEKLAQVKASELEKSIRRTEQLQAKIDAAQRKLRQKENEIAAKLQSVKDEAKDKVAVLEAQKATATQESRANLDRRLTEVRRDYEQRIDRLRGVLEDRKTANASIIA